LLFKSPKTLSNVFSKSGFKSPLQYIHERKMLEARRLLHHSDDSVKQIALEIGFDDIQAFSRFFKKNEGISPSKYKENTLSGIIANT
jgi:AraC-like DNA-binding protein